MPKSLPKDERAIYDFIQELYKTRRVSDKNFNRVNRRCWATRQPSSSSASSATT